MQVTLIGFEVGNFERLITHFKLKQFESRQYLNWTGIQMEEMGLSV